MGNPRVKNGHRRRELRARVIAEGGGCGICGGDVDVTLHYLHPMAPEVDEIIPISLGGDPLSRDNVRLTHRSCNQQRGNGQREREQAARDAQRAPVEASDIW